MAGIHHITKNGRRFTIQQMPLCDLLCVESRKQVWALWNGLKCGNNYDGNFGTKRDALARIDEILNA